MKTPSIIFDNIPSLQNILYHFPQKKGLFFDMDGTLLNTEVIHFRALKSLESKYHIKAPFSQEKIYELFTGKADYLIFEIIKDWPGFPSFWNLEAFITEKNEYMSKIVIEMPKESYYNSEMKSLLEEAKNDQLFLALVTSSEKKIVHHLLENADIKHFFDLVLTRDDCIKHKPDSWPYQHALQRSGLSSDEVLIFEDSEIGLTAAYKSGINVAKCQWF